MVYNIIIIEITTGRVDSDKNCCVGYSMVDIVLQFTIKSIYRDGERNSSEKVENHHAVNIDIFTHDII